MADDLSADLASLRIDRTASAPPSKGWGKFIIWLLLLAGAGAGAVAIRPQVEASLFKTSVALTTVASVSPAQASVELTATGYVQAEKNSRVAPKVAGSVSAVHVVQGQVVHAGDPLFELDPSDEASNILAAQSRVAVASADAKSAHARVLTAEADLAVTQLQAQRERTLSTKGLSPVSNAEDLDARALSLTQMVKAAQASAVAADAQTSASRAQVEVLKTALQNLSLVAPIDGTIVNKPPQVGEFVGPQPAGLSVDMGGIRVADFSTLLVETDVPETRLDQVKIGGPAEIVLDAYAQKRFRGLVKEITPQVDRAKATVVVKVSFVDALEGVLPDMAARVSFLSKPLDEQALKEPPKIIVPKTALALRGGSQVVFVKDGDTARMVNVQLGPAFGDGFELVSGPSPGTQLIASPPATLKDGQKIKEAEPES